jgi:amino acid adenylation domain-containing protein
MMGNRHDQSKRNRKFHRSRLDNFFNYSNVNIKARRFGARDNICFVLSRKLTQAIKQFASKKNYSLNSVLLAIFNALFYRYTSQTNVAIFVTSIAHCSDSGKLNFSNSPFVLKTQIAEDLTFSLLLDQVHKLVIGAMVNQEPLPSIDRQLLENNKYDLFLGIYEENGNILCDLKCKDSLFKKENIGRVRQHFAGLAKVFLSKPDMKLDEASIVTDQEKRWFQSWNKTNKNYPENKTLADLFSEQAKKNPHSVAIKFNQQSLTYCELDEKAERLAAYLKSLGVGPDRLVGIYINRSFDLIIGLLAVIKAGGAYVPLDPKYPLERIEYILKDAKVKLVITQKDLLKKLSNISANCIVLDESQHFLGLEQQKVKFDDQLDHVALPKNLAYVIYTSGSTGNPKGVQVTHKSLVNFLFAMQDQLHLTSADRWLAVTTISFDIAGLEIYLPLITGAQIILASAEITIDFAALSKLIASGNITVMQATPVTWRSLLSQKTWKNRSNLKILCGGEAMPLTLAEKLLNISSHVWNLYGPTETTIWSTTHRLIAENLTSIGKPIANTKVYVLSKCHQLTPVGVPGELYIGGDGLARGYLNQPQLTLERFIRNPFENDANERLYKTGDLVRWLPDGSIEYIERVDNQVKIRGFRIELGEIENHLNGYPAIQEAVVVTQEDNFSNKQLIACVISKAGKNFNANDLRVYLQQKLPDYMVPAHFVQLEALPLTPNGKVDRKALSKTTVIKPRLNVEYLAPQNDLEKTISAIWKKVLGLDGVGIHDNFFDIGGNSLLMAHVAEELKLTLNQDIPIVKLYQYPTVYSLAKELSNKADKESVELGIRSKNNKASQDIAVIGMAGKFPGAESIEALWRNVISGKESITFFSEQSLLEAGVGSQTLSKANYVKANGVLGNVDLFDAEFFDINNHEAALMDPQHRLFLECAWQALEQAGYSQGNSNIAVFAGTGFFQHYFIKYLLNTFDADDLASQYAVLLGNLKDTLATRVSYKLNLTGPSIAVQTTCSTSLVAICQACECLMQGNCDIALAGGVSIRLPEEEGYGYQENMIFSPDGHCRPFDAAAKGTVMGNGLGVVVLKRLDDAIADNDYIHAVIKGYGLNNDGATKPGYTAPSVEGQSRATAAALAEIDPETISYIEAHGTATEVGDPIEVEALTKAFRKRTARSNFCAIGSVKANIGHLDAAAGVAGFIKTVEALKHKQIPPAINFDLPNKKIDFANTPFFVNTAPLSWESINSPRRAGISSFGLGGTNAHVILEEAPERIQSDNSRNLQLLMLSAKTETALDAMMQNLGNFIKDNPTIPLADIAYTLQVGRKLFPRRRFFVCESNVDAVDICFKKTNSQLYSGLQEKFEKSIVFLFPGQGSQYVNMGIELYQQESEFRKTIDYCAELLAPLLHLDIREILYPVQGEEDLKRSLLLQTAYTQPAIFVIEYALAKLLMSWGIKPAAMLGHSLGEYVAACLSGVFTLDDALRLVALRGQLIQQLPAGGMLAVSLPVSELRTLLIPQIEIAAINSSQNCVVSGPFNAIEKFEVQLASKKIICKRLHTSHAFHSAMLDPILEKFRECVSSMSRKPPNIPYISNLTGTWVIGEEVVSADYWVQHLRNTVCFAEGLDTLSKMKETIFLEVGPGKVLASLAKSHIQDLTNEQIVACMKHPQEEKSDIACLLTAVGKIWLGGGFVDWKLFYGQERRCFTPLPTYPFERKRHWINDNTRVSKNVEDIKAVVKNTEQLKFHGQVTGGAIPSHTKIEQEIAEIWSEFFKKTIQLNDNFFELGGDSLLGIQLLTRIRERYQVDLSNSALFSQPTVVGLAKTIAAKLKLPVDSGITLIDRAKPIPLSFGQQRLWFLNKLEPNSTAYNIPLLLRIQGNLNVSSLEFALNKVMARHEVLRTILIESEGKPTQCIFSEMKLVLDVNDLTALNKQQKQAQKELLIKEKMFEQFDLSSAPLIRSHLLKLESSDYLLLISLHHSIADGWSLNILAKEIVHFYQSQQLNQGSALPELPVQYADFTVWQKNYWDEKDSLMEHQLKYWQSQLAGAPVLLNLPLDYPRPSVKTSKAGSELFKIPRGLRKKIVSFAEKEKVTLFMVVLSAFSILLSRYSTQDDIVVGTPVAGRNRKEIEDLIGFFVNTLALRIKMNSIDSFAQLLQQVKEVVIKAFDNQDVPFEKLIESLNLPRSLSYSPLFQVMLVFLDMSECCFAVDNLTFNAEVIKPQFAKFDLTLMCIKKADDFFVRIDYATSIFKTDTIKVMGEQFLDLLKTVITSPNINLYEISLAALAEKKNLSADISIKPIEYLNRALHQLFEEQAEGAPSHAAVIFEDQKLTYEELNNRANQLAVKLKEFKVEADIPVAICMPSSLETVISILAVLKAGGAYVPLDTRFPLERQQFILDDTRAPVVITTTELIGNFDNYQGEIININNFVFDNNKKYSNLPIAIHNHCLAYIIYTSGSTGKPKGVMIEHRQITNYVSGIIQRLQPKAGDNFALISTMAADLGNTVLYGALCSGGCLHIVSPNIMFDAFGVADYFARNAINYLKITPSHFSTLFGISNSKDIIPNTCLIFGGEPTNWSLVESIKKAKPEVRILNHYGPTETTVGVLTYEYLNKGVAEDAKTLPLGLPLLNSKCYVLDESLKPVPIGVKGELYIGGAGLARGYLNQPNLTRERFIEDPFSSPSEKLNGTKPCLYKTGDIVRCLSDGNIEYIGRVDHQVKIRGFRVELGEIEAVLRSHPDVREAIVIAKQDDNCDNKYLVAYWLSKVSAIKREDDLLGFLRKSLPDYMIPLSIIELDSFPLTPNGKVDRDALFNYQCVASSSYQVPRDNLELTLLQAWTAILGNKDIGIQQNFFELGGHSLKAMELIHKVNQLLQTDLSLAYIFAYPTIDTFARAIRQKNVSPIESFLVPIQPYGSKPPLFAVHPIGGSALCYYELSKYLGSEQPLYGLQQVKILDYKSSIGLESFAKDYVEAIKKIQPNGPYRLIGWSLGGVIAHEIAHWLEQQGEKVIFLGLIDSRLSHKEEEISEIELLLQFVRDLSGRYGKNLEITQTELMQLTSEERISYLLGKAKEHQLVHQDLSSQDMVGFVDQIKFNWLAAKEHKVKVIHAPLTLYVASDSFDNKSLIKYEGKQAWRRYTNTSIVSHQITGDHYSIMQHPGITRLAELLATQLDDKCNNI